jgi:hypothetical protein
MSSDFSGARPAPPLLAMLFNSDHLRTSKFEHTDISRHHNNDCPRATRDRDQQQYWPAKESRSRLDGRLNDLITILFHRNL